jgi:ubiquinone/menaquinone biosynthesis C-methylase UbiE
MINYTTDEIEVVKKYDKFIGQINGFSFMNDGYVDLDQFGFPVIDTNLKLLEKYNSWRYQAQLYKKCLDYAGIEFNTNQGTLLDLSCGKGGGLSFFKDHYQFQKLIGVDLNPTHIEICKKNVPGIEFITASATDIPLEDSSIDIITTIEASAYYDPFDQYLKESYRLLKPGGMLIQAGPDLFDMNQYADHGFKFHNIYNITKNVRTACAISKYILLELDPSGVSFECLLGDESRYIQGQSFYNIVIFSK